MTKTLCYGINKKKTSLELCLNSWFVTWSLRKTLVTSYINMSKMSVSNYFLGEKSAPQKILLQTSFGI